MKIGSSHDGVVYGARGLAVGAWQPKAGFERLGTLPNPSVPATGKQKANFGPLNRWWVKRVLSHATGWYTTTNVWPVDDHTLLATVGHCLFRSTNGGNSWQQVYELPLESGPMGTLPTSLAKHDGKVFLAEYTFGDVPARVLVSDDGGRTWSTYVERSNCRHFHGVFRDTYGDKLWATTGDTDAESAIGFFEDGDFHAVGSGSQRWRAVGLAFTPDSIIWGMDCSYADSIRVFRLDRDEVASDDPEPEVIHVADGTVYYTETLEVSGETWVFLSTAAGVGVDDTAPAGSRNTCSRSAQVLATSSESNYKRWYELYSFDRRRTINEYFSNLPAANGYVFIDTDPQLGLIANPFNMKNHHGDVFSVPVEWLRHVTRYEPDVEKTRSRASPVTGHTPQGVKPRLQLSIPEPTSDSEIVR